jgi:hypothetical protein
MFRERTTKKIAEKESETREMMKNPSRMRKYELVRIKFPFA